MQHPGEVWFLPPDVRHGGDPKTRRHVLLTTCGIPGDVAILAYASTQGTEAAFGAANVLLDPYATADGSRGRTGFEHPTYIYPSRLVSAAPAVLGQPWVPQVNAAMHSAWLAVDMVQTVFHPTEISRWTGATADEGTMAELDAYLLHLFGL
jgi:hypothetical protein